jgi:lysophospholipase L1-like esterase
MLDTEGEPIKEIFTDDSLHMNEKGYAIWQKEIKPYLRK